MLLRRGGKVVWDATNTRRDFRCVPPGLGLDNGALITLAVVLAQQIDNAEFPYPPEAHRTVWLDEYHRETGRVGFRAAK